MDPMIWSISLLLLGLGLLVLEFFVPSGGVLSFLSIVSVVASIIVAFTASVRFGVIMLTVTTVIIPVVVVLAVRWWPHTPIGRLVLIGRPEDPDDVLPDTEEYRGLTRLIGQFGRARGKMLPAGSVLIGGRTYDAISEGMAIDAGQPIKVVDVRTNRIVVRPSEREALVDDERAAGPADDILSRPADAFGLEELDDPLA